MSRAAVPLLLGASLMATAAQAQGPDGRFHDCQTAKRSPTWAMEASADGVPLRLGAAAAHALAARGWRFYYAGPVDLSCVAVADQPRHCVSAYQPRGSFVRCIDAAIAQRRRCFQVQRSGPVPAGQPDTRLWLVDEVLRAMDTARLTGPAGAWPIHITVSARISDPGDPSLVPCGSGA